MMNDEIGLVRAIVGKIKMFEDMANQSHRDAEATRSVDLKGFYEGREAAYILVRNSLGRGLKVNGYGDWVPGFEEIKSFGED